MKAEGASDVEDLESGGQIDLRHWLGILRRRKILIICTTGCVILAALAYSFLAAPTYTAQATVLVPQEQASAALNIQNSQLGNAADLQRYLADQQDFASGDMVRRIAAQSLGYKAGITVSTSLTADVLSFTANGDQRGEVAATANAYANAYIAAYRATQVDDYTQRITALQTSIAALKSKEAALSQTDPQYAALQQSTNTLTQTVEQTQAAMQLTSQVGPSILTAAHSPTRPSSPKPAVNGAVGAFGGIGFGLILAVLMERIDDRIRSREDAERAAKGRPLVGMLPLVESWTENESHHLALQEDPDSPAAEAYRTLRTAVQFMKLDSARKIIGITSSIPNEGKTTAAANLALSFARSGQKVAVVSCDLRRGRLHEFFALPNRPGLTSVLLGEATLAEAMMVPAGEALLSVLPSGPVPPNPAEILAMKKVEDILQSIAKDVDLVLVDCPPVLPVADALLVSRLVDGILVLASAKMTSQRDLRRTLELLDQVQSPIMGFALNRVPSEATYTYGGNAYRYRSDRQHGSSGGRPKMNDQLGQQHASTAEAQQGRGVTGTPQGHREELPVGAGQTPPQRGRGKN